jgi:hypothetical protein
MMPVDAPADPPGDNGHLPGSPRMSPKVSGVADRNLERHVIMNHSRTHEHARRIDRSWQTESNGEEVSAR